MRPRKFKTQDVVALYTQQHLTCEEIGRMFSVSRAAVAKRLRQAGIPTAKGEWVQVYCAFCGADIKRTRARWRNAPDARHFCATSCYAGFRANPNSYSWRHGTRLARLLVGSYFHLEDGMIVHHKDGDERNNDIANLCVYASSSDHIRAHHGKTQVEPVWDGAREQALWRYSQTNSGRPVNVDVIT